MIKTTLALAGALAVVPLAAQADPINPRILQEHRSACVAKCESSKSEASCLQLCDCVTDQIAANWTLEDYEMRHKRVSDDPADLQVNREYRAMGRQCLSQAPTWESGS